MVMSVAPSQRLSLPSQLGLLAALGSGALLGGAYYFQYVVGLPPCDLCYLQRWPHMVAIAAGLAALAAFARPRLALVLVLTAITALLVTAAIGVFHVGVEYHWWEGPQACSGNVPRGLSPEQLKKYLFGAKMVRCDQALTEAGVESRLILQIHDELLFEGPAAEAEAVKDVACREMASAFDMDPPLAVEAGIGPDWLKAK